MDSLLGYTVDKNENDDYEGGSRGYFLYGPRGACYALLRNMKNPDMLYAVNARPGKFGIVSVKGYNWFYDGDKTDGVLTPVN